MDEWLHCNSCFLQPDETDENKLRFHLTSCGHIFCEFCGCFVDPTSDRCKLCKTQCSSTKIGDETFKNNKIVQEYFQKPVEAGEKFLNVLKFQKAHTNKLIKHHKLLTTKYNRAKLYIRKLENELKSANRALKGLPQNHQYNVTDICSNSMVEFDATPFKMIATRAKEQNTSTIKQNIPDSMRYRKSSNQHDNSTVSSEITLLSPGSSKYASPENLDDKFMHTIDVMHLQSTGRGHSGSS